MMVFFFRNCFAIIVRKDTIFHLLPPDRAAVGQFTTSDCIHSMFRIAVFPLGEPPSCKLLLVIRKGTLPLPSVGAKPRYRRLEARLMKRNSLVRYTDYSGKWSVVVGAN